MALSRPRALTLGLAIATLYGSFAFWAGASSPLAAVLPVFALSFLIAVPFAVGFVTFAATRSASLAASLLIPWTAFGVMLVVAWLAQWDGLIYLVFALPWLLPFSSLGGLAARSVGETRYRLDAAVAVMLAPIVLAPIERRLPLTTIPDQTTTSVSVAAPPHVVWEYVVAVDSIRATERGRGVLTPIGFPAPINATLDGPRVGGRRVATFESNLAVVEQITEWWDAERLSFHLQPDPAQRPIASLDRHVRLGGDYFDIPSASYDLDAIGDSATRLTLTVEYRFSTRINWYATWLAHQLAPKLQQPFLRVVVARSERAFKNNELALTADMRELETALANHGESLWSSSGDDAHQIGAAMIVTGERAIASVDDAVVPATAEPALLDNRLRGALQAQASRARASGWATLSSQGGASSDSDRTMRFEFEDRAGRCVASIRSVRPGRPLGSRLGPRQLVGCNVSVLADMIRRGRRLARMPLRVNSMEVTFTTVGDYPARVEVFADSVVVPVRNGTLMTKLLRGRRQTVDSVTASLAARSGQSWSEGTRSNALVLEWQGDEGEKKNLLPLVRFTIPRDSAESLAGRWVLFTHYLTVAKTPENPYGLAWTYAHGPEGMFKGLVEGR